MILGKTYKERRERREKKESLKKQKRAERLGRKDKEILNEKDKIFTEFAFFPTFLYDRRIVWLQRIYRKRHFWKDSERRKLSQRKFYHNYELAKKVTDGW